MGSEKKDEKSVDATITVCGPDGAGKTSLIHRILYDTFPEAPLPVKITQFFKQTFSLSHSGLTKPEDKKSITFCEPVNGELFNSYYKAFNGVYFLSAKYTLIVVDSEKLPSTEKLKDYFSLVGNDSTIHLVVNKIDDSDQFDKTKNSIESLLTGAGVKVSPTEIHYISAKNNHGIQELREHLGIPNPSPHKLP